MKKLLILLIIVINTLSYGQCKFIKNGVSEYDTTKHLLSIQTKNVGKLGYLADYSILSINSNIAMSISFSDYSMFRILKGAKIEIKTKDSVLTMYAANDAISNYSMIGSTGVYKGIVLFEVSIKDLEYLSKHHIQKIRISLCQGYKELFWKEKGSPDFVKMVECFLSEYKKQ